jgi:hypothetical protein
MTVKTRNVIIGICVAIIALFLSGYLIGHRKGVNALQPTVHLLNTEISRITVELNNTKLYVTSIEQEITTLRQAKTDGDVTAKELRVLNLKQVNEISRLKLKIDTLISVENNANVVFVHDSADVNDQKAVLLPFVVTKYDKWLSLKDSTDLFGKTIVSLSLDVPLDIYTGIDSKTKLPVAKVSSSNPYVGVLSINSIKMDTPKEKKFNISIFAGYGACKTGLSPIAGIGCGITIFRF